jgi:hypothetical protein
VENWELGKALEGVSWGARASWVAEVDGSGAARLGLPKVLLEEKERLGEAWGRLADGE